MTIMPMPFLDCHMLNFRLEKFVKKWVDKPNHKWINFDFRNQKHSSNKVVEVFEFTMTCIMPLDLPNQIENCQHFHSKTTSSKKRLSCPCFHPWWRIFLQKWERILSKSEFQTNFQMQEFMAEMNSWKILSKMKLSSSHFRLHWFGFMTTGDDAFFGNIELWNQNTALKFIHKNIKFFGGNPNKMTLMEHSAESASIHFHMISPHSRDLIKRFIPMSGNLYCSWSMVNPYQCFQTILNKILAKF